LIIAFSIIFFLATFYIFTTKKNGHLKFLYPGLVTFFVFMILPIIFTIYISFTNLKTGHFLTLEETKNILLEEVIISADKKSYYYKINKHNEIYTMDVDIEGVKHSAQFNLNDNNLEYALRPSESSADLHFESYKVFKILEKLKKLVFYLPSGKELKVHRTNLLLNLKPRYTLLKSAGEDDSLKDNTDNAVYKPNLKSGYYESEGKNLIPGFYVNVGLSNFLDLINNESISSSFLRVFIWTLIWSFTTVLLTFVFGMFLAILLNEKSLKLKKVYRILFIIPYSVPFFISILIFRGMLNKDFGVVNEMLSTFGIAPLSWLETPLMAKISCLMVNLWLGFPYMFLVTTGILQSIPESIYEAAKLDGASKWITFNKLTLPLLMTGVGPLLIGSFAFNMNNFVGIYLLTGGGPPIAGAASSVGSTDILISYTYRLAFEGGSGQDFGLASAIALCIFFIITVLTMLNFKLTNSKMGGAS
jgi:maltose/maltodextrin transport system permease protein